MSRIHTAILSHCSAYYCDTPDHIQGKSVALSHAHSALNEQTSPNFVQQQYICRFKKGFDEEDDDDDEGSSESDSLEDSASPAKTEKQEAKQPSKRAKAGPQLEDLQELGFRTGPSILTMKEQPPDSSYEW